MLENVTRGTELEIVPASKLAAKVAGLFLAPFDHFVTSATEELRVGFEGIEGDFHAGHTRRSGGREPWYPRGMEMRNERQLSIVAVRPAMQKPLTSRRISQATAASASG